MRSSVGSKLFVIALLSFTTLSALHAADVSAQLEQVISLGRLDAAPATHAADGFPNEDGIRAIFFDALPWKGKPTRAFAWLGVPANRNSKVPGVVLVHGGGGTAFIEWVKKWNEHGFAAISIAVEGQTDQRDVANPKAWQRHNWAGPARDGIYGDSTEPLSDQWIYHAVADTVLANSLLRSLPEVDADRIGVMGISWGGVITSTVIGIDSRFAFAIPTYGCGHLFDADNHYGRALGKNELYQQVWDPMVRLSRAKLPVLWFSWPQDQSFPLDCQAACYRVAPGPHMVSLIPGLRHGHAPAWNAPDSYAFAESVVRADGPWCKQSSATIADGVAQVEFIATKTLDRALLCSTTDLGITGNRKWIESSAKLEKSSDKWIASAVLPSGTTAWFINVRSGDLTASSDYQNNAHSAVRVDRAKLSPEGKLIESVPFTWDRVPVYAHVGKSSDDFTPDELDFLAKHFDFIAIEKNQAIRSRGNTEAGIAEAARQIKLRKPNAKVLYYWNSFLNLPSYKASKDFPADGHLNDQRGRPVMVRDTVATMDLSRADVREWWSDTAAKGVREGGCDGIFADALLQVTAAGKRKLLGDEKYAALNAGLVTMLQDTRNKCGADKLVIFNGLRGGDGAQFLPLTDGAMIEHFGHFSGQGKEKMAEDLDAMQKAARAGKIVCLKAWPGFSWQDAEMMKKPHDELHRLASERLVFPLACFLVAAESHCYFCYTWGYTEAHGTFDWYPEFDKPLGKPKGEAVRNGWTYNREFERASVSVDLEKATANISWR